jgi:hypothetical protein
VHHGNFHSERRAADPVRWLVVGAAGSAIDWVKVLVVRYHKLKRRGLEQSGVCVDTVYNEYSSRGGRRRANAQLCVAKTNELFICASNLYAGSPCQSRLCSNEILCLVQALALKCGSAGLKPAIPSAESQRKMSVTAAKGGES